MGNLILNLAGGKIVPLDLLQDDNIIHLDTMYDKEICCSLSDLNGDYINGDRKLFRSRYINHDVEDFLDKSLITFDRIAIYRFLEHVPKSKVIYFIYLLSTCVRVNGYIDVIVPDAKILAKKIIDEDVNSPSWESDDLLITYELLADQPSPHLSLWTRDRLIKLFEREGNFKTVSVDENFKFDGRDIYLRYIAKREK